MFRRSLCLAASMSLFALGVSTVRAADLSKYRVFQFGMDLATAAQRAQMQPSDARVVYQRPALIQALEWRGYRFTGASDPVKQVVLSFYNGELFRMVVFYDHYKTEGLTPNDMIDAISATYGTATTPVAAEVIIPSIYSQTGTETMKVMARWEDSQYSYNLVGLSDSRDFAVLLFSKHLESLANAAVIEAVRLDKEEAPQREIDLRKQQQEESQRLLDKARVANQASFRP